MNVLITGSAGFIGFHVAKYLLDRGEEVWGLDNFNPYYSIKLKEDRNTILSGYKNYHCERIDLCDNQAIQEIFKKKKYDVVCNLAAQAGVRYSLSHPHEYIDSNITGFFHILEACRHNQIRRLVYASSSSVYGGCSQLPFSEKVSTDTPVSLYAASKKSNELMAHVYSHLFSLQTIGLRFFTVYGPWGRPDMALWLFTDAILKGNPIEIYNHGDMCRDFTYIDDIVQGVIACIDTPGLPSFDLFNLGNNHSEQLLDLIEIIESTLGKKAIRKYSSLQPGDVKATYADIRHASEMLCFKPSTKISEGVPRFIQWFKSYHTQAN